jgi:hypothetical protein
MRTRIVLLAALICTAPLGASAQQRPLVTEDPETVGEGRMLVEAGVDYVRDAEFPVSGLQGNLFRGPLIGISIGLGAIGEAQIDGGLYNHLSITDRRPAPLSHMLTVTGDSTWSIEDLTIGTKIRVVSEGVSRPAVAIRTAARLPNTSNESGLGLDTMDFYSSLILAKTVQSVRIVGNVGLGILGDPTRGDRQNDVITYGLSFARAVTTAAEVVGEVNGRKDTRAGDPPPGTESRGMARFGARYTIGTLRADAAILFGLTSNDPSFGVATGFTYVFNAPRLP